MRDIFFIHLSNRSLKAQTVILNACSIAMNTVISYSRLAASSDLDSAWRNQNYFLERVVDIWEDLETAISGKDGKTIAMQLLSVGIHPLVAGSCAVHIFSS